MTKIYISPDHSRYNDVRVSTFANQYLFENGRAWSAGKTFFDVLDQGEYIQDVLEAQSRVNKLLDRGYKLAEESQK